MYIVYFYLAELFSPDIKEVAVGIATSINWCSAFLVTLFFTPLQVKYFFIMMKHLLFKFYIIPKSVFFSFKQRSIHSSGTYWFFAACNTASFLFTLVFVWETKGKSLETIAKHFGKQ